MKPHFLSQLPIYVSLFLVVGVYGGLEDFLRSLVRSSAKGQEDGRGSQQRRQRLDRPKVQFDKSFETKTDFSKDPSGQITCHGPLPPVDWPVSLRTDANPPYRPWQFTLQQLCAKPQYGGAPRGNIGGWCYDPFSRKESHGQPRPEGLRKDFLSVNFDTGLGSGASSTLGTPRFQAYCLQFCWCSDRLDDVFPPRRKTYEIVERTNRNRYGFGDINQVNPDVNILAQQTVGLDGFPGTRQAVKIPHRPQNWDHSLENAVIYEHMKLAENNKIICQGDLPDFELPDRWLRTDFQDNQGLCATALDRGMRDANAGGYCNTVVNPDEPFVDFSGELTPSLFFMYGTFGGLSSADQRRARAVRLWCEQKCECAPRKNQPPKLVPVKGEVLQVKGSTADVFVVQTVSRNVVTKTYRLVPETGSCEAPTDNNKACVPLLPDNLLPVPKPISHTAPPMNDFEPKNPLLQCGSACTRYGDCGGYRQQTDCRCVADPTPFEAQQVGADPVGTVALCLLVSSLAYQSKGYLRNSLGGRSVEKDENREWWNRPDLPCPCNQTYVSQGCCNSTTGMVWEHPSLRLGRLA